MDVLVVSDSHGILQNLRRIIEKESGCKTVFFLGDGARDIEECKKLYPEKSFIAVRGNNDWSSELEEEAYKYIEGNTVVAVHGHRFSVRYSLYELFSKAASVRANVVFYGHTHIQNIELRDGICAVNPGAVCEGKYAVVSLTKDGPEPKLKSIY